MVNSGVYNTAIYLFGQTKIKKIIATTMLILDIIPSLFHVRAFEFKFALASISPYSQVLDIDRYLSSSSVSVSQQHEFY